MCISKRISDREEKEEHVRMEILACGSSLPFIIGRWHLIESAFLD